MYEYALLGTLASGRITIIELSCMCRLCVLQKLAVRGFYTGTGYAPFVAASELAVKVC